MFVALTWDCNVQPCSWGSLGSCCRCAPVRVYKKRPTGQVMLHPWVLLAQGLKCLTFISRTAAGPDFCVRCLTLNTLLQSMRFIHTPRPLLLAAHCCHSSCPAGV